MDKQFSPPAGSTRIDDQEGPFFLAVAAGCRSYLVASTLVTDVVLKPDHVEPSGGTVDFTFRGVRWVIPHEGHPLEGEGKRTAACSLDQFRHVPGTVCRPGGGGANSAVFVRRLEPAARVTVIDDAGPDADLSQALSASGVSRLATGVAAPNDNLVLAFTRPDTRQAGRIVLRGPTDPRSGSMAGIASSHSEGARREAMLTRLDWPGRGRGALWLNSCRSSILAHRLSDGALDRGLPQCSVLTPALPAEQRVSLLLERDVLSVANWEETSVPEDK